MKVERQSRPKPVQPFEPFDVVITIESEEEARGLYALFNRIHNCVVLPPEMPKQIRQAIGDQYYGISDQITEKVSYGDYYPGWPKRP